LKAHESHDYILVAGAGQWMEINITPDVAVNSPQIIVYSVDGTDAKRQVSPGWMRIDPELVFIQEEPRFQALIQ